MPARSRPRPRPNHAGVHHLSCPRTLRAIVRSAALARGQLVYDLGAGPGTLTAALAATGARVVAVEREARFAATLRRRFDGDERVRVVEGDLRTVAIPRTARIVANLPFATSGAVVARLLDPPGAPAPAPTCSWRRASRGRSPAAGRARRRPPGAPRATRSRSDGRSRARRSLRRRASTRRCCGSGRGPRSPPTPSGGCGRCWRPPTAGAISARRQSPGAARDGGRGCGCSRPPASRWTRTRSRCRRTSGRRWRAASDAQRERRGRRAAPPSSVGADAPADVAGRQSRLQPPLPTRRRTCRSRWRVASTWARESITSSL